MELSLFLLKKNLIILNLNIFTNILTITHNDVTKHRMHKNAGNNFNWVIWVINLKFY